MQTNFREYVDHHTGVDFLICGNGYSLTEYPKSFYENFDGVTMGDNRILKWFTPNYYICAEEPGMINWDMPDKVSCPWIAAKSSRQPKADIIFDWTATRGPFYTEKDGLASWGHSSIFYTMSMAYQMGARSIGLIGVDFCKGPEGQPYFDSCFKEHVKQFYLEDEAGDIEMRKRTLDWFSEAFDSLRGVGIKVYNLSSISKLPNIDYRRG